MAQDLTGQNISTHDIGANKNVPGEAQRIWQVWLDITSELLLSLVFSIDPDIIVLGGGLSQISKIESDLENRLRSIQLKGFSVPSVVVAQGGDASGAKGAALAAAQEAGNV
jgi:N-acetylglucosamine kinase